VPQESVLEEEKTSAREAGRCMGCGAPTKYFKTAQRFALLCKDKECFRYYQKLYYGEIYERRNALRKTSEGKALTRQWQRNYRARKKALRKF